MKEHREDEESAWFLSALTLLFIGLKLTGYINWNWFWVLSPILIPFSIIIIFILYVIFIKD